MESSDSVGVWASVRESEGERGREGEERSVCLGDVPAGIPAAAACVRCVRLLSRDRLSPVVLLSSCEAHMHIASALSRHAVRHACNHLLMTVHTRKGKGREQEAEEGGRRRQRRRRRRR